MFVYDIETYPNVFTCSFEHVGPPIKYTFELSEFKDESKELIAFLKKVYQSGTRLVGFNNLGFDYPVLHQLLFRKANYNQLYEFAQTIITSEKFYFPEKEIAIPQLDLYKIHHFDNKAKAVGLKALEFVMRADSIEDLPYVPGTRLTKDQIKVLKKYNRHDVSMTKKFYHLSKDMIDFREELSGDKDFTNFNDTKIGKEYFITQLQTKGIRCYDYVDNRRVPIQSEVDELCLGDCMIDIKYAASDISAFYDQVKNTSISLKNGVLFKDVKVNLNGFAYTFGLGGLHGSLKDSIVEGDYIIDLDVSSYYPNLAITNRFYPRHLSEKFCDIYKDLYYQRSLYEKGTAQNAMLKLALNGVYGDSKNVYSPFYDPKFTFQITMNGQFLLMKLIEMVTQSGAQLIQANTDGITIKTSNPDFVMKAAAEWERLTGLTLERNDYEKMVIRDVNNYIAMFKNGKIKRRGVYEYKRDYHQDHSFMVVPKVVEKVFLDASLKIKDLVYDHSDKYDFFSRIRTRRCDTLYWGESEMPKTIRCYVSTVGESLFKIYPKSKSPTAIYKNRKVQICNHINDFKGDIDYDFYIERVEDLCLKIS